MADGACRERGDECRSAGSVRSLLEERASEHAGLSLVRQKQKVVVASRTSEKMTMKVDELNFDYFLESRIFHDFSTQRY